MPAKLPLWNAAIFVDWNGVLSRDPFWQSILQSQTHPLYKQLTTKVRRLFRDGDFVSRWMRGELSSKDALAQVEVNLDQRFGSAYLERRLLEDCQRMAVNEGLVSLLATASQRAFIVIATDNMDCFYEQLVLLRAKRRYRRRIEGDSVFRLRDIACYFDEILCSSALGALKREQPDAFFGRWLRDHRLLFSQSLLLDDDEANCAAFRSAGGAAIRVRPQDFAQNFEPLKSPINTWLETAISASPAVTESMQSDAQSSVVKTEPARRSRQLLLDFAVPPEIS